MKLRILAVIPVLLLATACARDSTKSSSAGAPAASAISSPACASTLNVTADDANKTLCVTAGGKVMVDLGDAADHWLAIESGGPNLAAIPTFAATPGKAMFNATTAGTTTITSSRANCPSSPGTISCHSLVSWSVTVQVK